MPDVREIISAWQNVNAGDDVWLHPKATPLKVLFINPATTSSSATPGAST